jgi:uncharacterized repeat protein (TIGR03809 family)
VCAAPKWVGAAVVYGVDVMQEKQPIRDNLEMARRWHALAERRRQHFADLHDSGRWRKYYREHDFLTQMRATTSMVDAWEKVSRNGSVPAKVNGTSHSANGIKASANGIKAF